jgi:hypothetical protein
MGAAPNFLLPASTVPGLVPAGFAGQVSTLFHAHIGSPEGKEFDFRCLKQLPPSLATFQDGAARDEPSHIRGT